MIEKIKERAAIGKLHYSWVVTIGESLNISELLGEGYYKIVIKVSFTFTLGYGMSVLNEDVLLSRLTNGTPMAS